jgi:anti-anti-sigma factor
MMSGALRAEACPMSAGSDRTIHTSSTGADGERPFRLTVEPAADGTAVVAITGELDLSTVPALRGALAGARERSARRVVVDLTDVTFVDSVGVGAILQAKRRLGAGGDLSVVVAPETYARVIFDAVGVDALVRVVATRDEALAGAAIPA